MLFRTHYQVAVTKNCALTKVQGSTNKYKEP